MAQVILSSVGQSIGGPIGSAIGSTIGRAIDQRAISSLQPARPKGRCTSTASSSGTCPACSGCKALRRQGRAQ